MRQTQTPEGKSVRLLRIGEQVRHVLAGVLGRGEVRDPVLETHIVSVSEVRVSPDLRIATAFVKALGGDDDEVLAALKRNAKYLRGEVARSMSTKYTPELKFRLDESYEEASRIDKLLRDPKVARDLED
ncbi:MAG: 30S ribosome-binding factor RbfA [Sphingosinicella sp.]|nr:30S ribosome-binding factor RbfA [Sphingosinicella sp.]